MTDKQKERTIDGGSALHPEWVAGWGGQSYVIRGSVVITEICKFFKSGRSDSQAYWLLFSEWIQVSVIQCANNYFKSIFRLKKLQRDRSFWLLLNRWGLLGLFWPASVKDVALPSYISCQSVIKNCQFAVIKMGTSKLLWKDAMMDGEWCMMIWRMMVGWDYAWWYDGWREQRTGLRTNRLMWELGCTKLVGGANTCYLNGLSQAMRAHSKIVCI